MGIDGRQWDTVAFHGLTKPFQSKGIRDFSPPRRGRNDGFFEDKPLGAKISAVLCPGKGGFWAFSDRPDGAARTELLEPGGAGREEKKKKKSQTACKPGSVPACAGDGHSSGTPVTGRLARPTRAAARKPACRRSSGVPPLLGLAPGGVCPATPVAGGAVRSYRTLSPLPSFAEASEGGLLSVALSLGSPPPAVNRHRVSVEPGLSSPRGFPHCERRPSGRLAGLKLVLATAASSAEGLSHKFQQSLHQRHRLAVNCPINVFRPKTSLKRLDGRGNI